MIWGKPLPKYRRQSNDVTLGRTLHRKRGVSRIFMEEKCTWTAISICTAIRSSTSQQHSCFALQNAPTFVHKSTLAAFLEETWAMKPCEREGTSCNLSPGVSALVHSFGDTARVPLCLSSTHLSPPSQVMLPHTAAEGRGGNPAHVQQSEVQHWKDENPSSSQRSNSWCKRTRERQYSTSQLHELYFLPPFPGPEITSLKQAQEKWWKGMDMYRKEPSGTSQRLAAFPRLSLQTASTYGTALGEHTKHVRLAIITVLPVASHWCYPKLLIIGPDASSCM